MKFLLLILSCFLISCFFTSLLVAQNLINLDSSIDFEIIEDSNLEQESSSWNKFFIKNVAGRIGLASGFGVYGIRENYFAQLQYNQKFTDWLNFYYTANVSSNYVRLNLKLRERCKEEPPASSCRIREGSSPLPDRISISQSENKFQNREFYLDLDLGNNIQLSLGDKLIVWGQFELFSPIDFVALPIKFSSLGLIFSKLDARLTQRVVQLNIYPYESLSVQGYYIPTASVDPFLETVIRRFRLVRDYREAAPEINGDITTDSGKAVPYGLIQPDDPSQKALRVLFYNNWGVAGITYHRGFNAFPSILASLDETNLDLPFIKEEQRYVERDVVGVEFSVPIKNLTWKLEIAYILNNLDRINLKTIDLDQRRKNQRDEQNKAETDVILKLEEWIRNNDNKLYYNYQSMLGAFGIDADIDLWKFNLVIFFFESYLSDNIKKLQDLEKELKLVRNEEINASTGNIFPSFNILRYLDDNKSANIGWIAGLIPGGFGTSIYFNKDYFESVTIIAALEAIRFLSDGTLLLGIGRRYEPLEPLSTGLRLGVIYRF